MDTEIHMHFSGVGQRPRSFFCQHVLVPKIRKTVVFLVRLAFLCTSLPRAASSHKKDSSWRTQFLGKFFLQFSVLVYKENKTHNRLKNKTSQKIFN